MSEQREIFNESWHRVAGQRVRLRPSVRLIRQASRGETWYVAHDAFTHQFYRFRPEAHDFVARLDGTRTIEEVWAGCLERNPPTAPGQGEVIRMLAALYNANLIIADVTSDAAQLFERQRKRGRQEMKAQLLGIFFLRIRLFDPQPWLDRAWPVVRWACTPAAGLAWLVVVGLGLATVFARWDEAWMQSQGLLAPGNLGLLYVGFLLAKIVHEFGHAFAVKKFGGEVHAMGLMLLVFTPVPYVDATAAWAFRERWQRVMVGLAGVIPELFLAAIAAVVWANTGEGVLHSLAHNLMVVSSVSTLLFNLNPLLKFDGYYVLSDLIHQPNLQPRAMRQLQHATERYAFGGRSSESPARSRREAWGLGAFGVASWGYRMFITVTIILFVADRYFGLGLLAAVIAAFGVFVMPLYKGFNFLVREPRIERVRGRAWAVTGAAVVVLVILLGVVPVPDRFRAPGVLRAGGSVQALAEASGFVREAGARSGESVRAGDVLFRLENPELDFSIAAVEASLDRVRARERQSMSDMAAAIEPLRQRREAVAMQKALLEREREALVMRAPADGRWVSPRADDLVGTWTARGGPMGYLVGEGQGWEFYAVVPQKAAGDLFREQLRGASVRVRGSAGREIEVTDWRVVPGRQDVLPTPALGWGGGGPIEVRGDDPAGVQTVEPFFLVVARVVPPAGGGVVFHERTGVIRFERPWSPLLVQWAQALRQLIQERYRL